MAFHKGNYWKEIVCYVACAKLGNKWYWVGDTAQQLALMHEDFEKRGIPAMRVAGTPKVVAKLRAKFGNTVGVLKRNMPAYPFNNNQEGARR